MKKLYVLLLMVLAISHVECRGQKDTLRAMAYNVLYYGNGCQGPNAAFHHYLRIINGYTNSDILSLEKMASISLDATDKSGVAPAGFADSILQYALNAGSDRYAYCPFTNESKSNNVNVLFYNKHKLGYSGMVCSYANLTDFNLYKLYYKEPGMDERTDTVFIYVLLNHNKSGDEGVEVRKNQTHGYMAAVKEHFSALPNLINLGDFNSRGSKEPFYLELTMPDDTLFRFYDPPFYPDRVFTYPADWDHEGKYSAYFTTSTRESAINPNNCGTGGGGKNWYDHIFLSGSIVNNTNGVRYIPRSYRTVGNDGQRYRVSVNNSNAHKNTSAPEEVIEALYRMSNKYPVMVNLEVSYPAKGVHTELANAKVYYKDGVEQAEMDEDGIKITFTEAIVGQELKCTLRDGAGKEICSKTTVLRDKMYRMKCRPDAGVYTLQITTKHSTMAVLTLTKK